MIASGSIKGVGKSFSRHNQAIVLKSNLFEGKLIPVAAVDFPPHTTLRTVHGILMVIFWTLFITLGRYVKKPIVYFGEVCVLVGAILAIIAIGTGPHFIGAHQGIGLFICILILIHLVLVLFNLKYHSNSKLFITTAWVERVLIFFGIINLILGMVIFFLFI